MRCFRFLISNNFRFRQNADLGDTVQDAGILVVQDVPGLVMNVIRLMVPANKAAIQVTEVNDVILVSY